MRCIFGIILAGVLLIFVPGCGDDASSGAAENTKSEAANLKAAQACLTRVGKYPQVDPTQPGAPRGSQLVTLTLEGLPDAEDAGILLAYHRGYFAEAGLKIDLHSPVVSRNVAGYLDEKVIDIGLMTQPQVVMSNAQGKPLVAVGSVIQPPLTAMMWLPGSGIDGVADFAGKTIAINGLPWEEAALEALLAEEGLSLEDINLRRPGYGLVSTLIDGSADAILGVSSNIEGVELEACGVEPVVTPLQKLGAPPFEELQVVVRRDRLAQNPGWIETFMSTLARGNAAAAEDPRAAAEAIAAARLELDVAEPQVFPLVQSKIEVALPRLSDSGYMSPARAARLTTWMREQGLIGREVPVSQLLINGFVDGDHK